MKNAMKRPRRTSVNSTDNSVAKVVVKVNNDESDLPISDRKLQLEQKQQSNSTKKNSENTFRDLSGNITEMSFKIKSHDLSLSQLFWVIFGRLSYSYFSTICHQ